MNLVPSKCLIIYDNDEHGCCVNETIMVGELLEMVVKGNPTPVIGTLYDIDNDVLWIDTSKGYGEHFYGVRSCDVIALTHKEWEPEELKEY